jgi:hypothetical protein
MVGRKQLKRVNGIVQSVQATAYVSGPILGGFLLSFFDTAEVLLIEALSF